MCPLTHAGHERCELAVLGRHATAEQSAHLVKSRVLDWRGGGCRLCRGKA